MSENKADLLTSREVAKRLQVTISTIHAWTRAGDIPSLRITPKSVRYDLAAVMTAIAAKSHTGKTGGAK